MKAPTRFLGPPTPRPPGPGPLADPWRHSTGVFPSRVRCGSVAEISTLRPPIRNRPNTTFCSKPFEKKSPPRPCEKRPSELGTRAKLAHVFPRDAPDCRWLNQHRGSPKESCNTAPRCAPYVQAVGPIRLAHGLPGRLFWPSTRSRPRPEAFEAPRAPELRPAAMIENRHGHSLRGCCTNNCAGPCLRPKGAAQQSANAKINPLQALPAITSRVRPSTRGGSLDWRIAVVHFTPAWPESRADDAWIAFRHAFRGAQPGAPGVKPAATCRSMAKSQWQAHHSPPFLRGIPFSNGRPNLIAPAGAAALLIRGPGARAAEAALRRALLA